MKPPTCTQHLLCTRFPMNHQAGEEECYTAKRLGKRGDFENNKLNCFQSSTTSIAVSNHRFLPLLPVLQHQGLLNTNQFGGHSEWINNTFQKPLLQQKIITILCKTLINKNKALSFSEQMSSLFAVNTAHFHTIRLLKMLGTRFESSNANVPDFMGNE